MLETTALADKSFLALLVHLVQSKVWDNASTVPLGITARFHRSTQLIARPITIVQEE
jgi:hypothetical protein